MAEILIKPEDHGWVLVISGPGIVLQREGKDEIPIELETGRYLIRSAGSSESERHAVE